MIPPPAVRIAPGHGIALRTSGIVAWIAPPPDQPGSPEVDLSDVVRGLVLAAGAAPGRIPVDFLTGLTGRCPWLTLAVVALGDQRGVVWTHGDADVTIEASGGTRVIDGQVGISLTEEFPLPAGGVRLGDLHGAAPWSHLVEGAVPAGGVAVVWAPVALDPEMAVGSPPGPEPEPRFEAVPLFDVEPAVAARPLPVAGETSRGPKSADPVRTGTEPTDSGAVIVPGLRCSRGHFNHPLAANCAWCGIGMIQVSHVLVRRPRPALGVLVVDGQATFTLDADYVIGRQPNYRSKVDGKQVREIMLVSDPSISRAHAAVRLREWEVYAEDLNSGLGTWVQQPGHQPIRIPPGQPVALTPGAGLFVGAHRLTYHSHHLR